LLFSQTEYITNKTELYEIMENSIPEMHIFLNNNKWAEMIQNAQVNTLVKKEKYSTEASMKFIDKKYII